MQGTKNYEYKLHNWKEKAKFRSKELHKQSKRIKELKESRDNWRSKYSSTRKELLSLQGEVSLLKKELFNNTGAELLTRDKPKHHSYGSGLMMLCILLRQQANSSLRGTVEMLKIMCLVLGLECKIPCKDTIQNWEKKLGFHTLENLPKDGAWVLIADESVSIGQEKLLVLLAVNISKYKFGQALNFKDTILLDLAISNSWTGLKISERISNLKQQGIDIIYGVSDRGSNLIRALKDSNIDRVDDCTHAFGNLLKNKYKKQEEFKAFNIQLSKFKIKICQSKYAEFLPPKQRTKCRFLNLWPTAKWAYQMFCVLENTPKELDSEIYEKLTWLKEYKHLIHSIYNEYKTMNQLFEILKKKGLSKSSKIACEQLLVKSDCPVDFKEGVNRYLEKNVGFQKDNQPLICCSDIIESYFGKYKYMLSKTGNPALNDACLCLANLSLNFNENGIKRAMEEVKIVNLQEWKKQNCKESLLKKKQKLSKIAGKF